MDASLSANQRRRSLRRAVQLECALVSDLWEDSAPHLATDLSIEGAWLCSALPLEPGTEVVVSFRPPRWPWKAPPLTTLAEVARVGMPRRRDDHQPAGMGLSFVAMDDAERERLAAALRGLPPPLPGLAGLAPRVTPGIEETQLVVDGVPASFTALGPLLTGGRPRAIAPLAPRVPSASPPRRVRSYRYRPPHERSVPAPITLVASSAEPVVEPLHPPLYLVSGGVA